MRLPEKLLKLLSLLVMTLPTLFTTRVVLQPAAAADLDPLWTIWREPDVRRYLFDDMPVTRDRAAEVLDQCFALANEGLGLWTVRIRDASLIIGCVGLMRATTAAECDRSLIGIVEPLAAFSPTVWHRGYACEALRALIAHGFNSLGLSKLAAVNDVPNSASDRMLSRLGFRATSECNGPRYRLRTYVLTPEGFAVFQKAPDQLATDEA